MQIEAPVFCTQKEFQNASEAIMNGKFLSYVPGDDPDSGWGYRTMEEVTSGTKGNASI